MINDNINKYLPLSEATYYLLVALKEPAHGYAIMQTIEAVSQGSVVIGPGTMYGAFATLEKQGLIEKFKEEDRRKYWALTKKGKQVLIEQVRRLEIMVSNGQSFMPASKQRKTA